MISNERCSGTSALTIERYIGTALSCSLYMGTMIDNNGRSLVVVFTGDVRGAAAGAQNADLMVVSFAARIPVFSYVLTTR
jgi:hypothetical protein